MEPPGPSSWIPGRLALPLIRNRLTFLRRLTARYGDVVFFRIGSTPFAILNHPEMVRDVLVTRHREFHKGLGLERARMLLGDGLLTSEDDRHRVQRRLMQPAFHRDRIDGYADTMVRYADRRQRGWHDGETIDVAREMAAITLAIAGKTLFDADIEREHADVGEALTAALTSFNLGMLPFGERLVRWPIPAARRFRRGRAALDAIVYRLIAERRASPETGRDLLSMLITATDDDGDGRGMTDSQLRDEAVTLLLAGHETTANALAWTWHLLAANPDVERRFHEEVDHVLADRPARADDLSHLPFTRAVLAESLRLYPPAYLLGRRALSTYQVPGTAYELPPRTVVFLSQYLLHRDPRFWDEPDAFRPERWLEAAGAPCRHRFAYFPFGAGPRVCIGEQFAWMEGILVLATLARHWTFRPQAGHVVTMQPIVTLRPRGGLPMRPARRDGHAPPHAPGQAPRPAL